MSLPSFVASTVRRRRHSLLLGSDITATLTASTFAPTANGIATTTLTATVSNNGDLASGQTVTYAVSRITLSAANSVVTASPATIQNDGIASSTVTITVLDADGNPLPGIAASDIVVAVSGTGNTITQPATATDANGQTTASFVTSGAATKTVSVTVCGLAVTDTASVVATAASGTVATVTEISRDAASTAGGVYVEFAITGAVDLPTVTFGGTSATGIVLVNSTTLGCYVPAKTAGVVAIVVGGQAFTNPRASLVGGDFEYRAAPTTTYFDVDFEDGTDGVLSASVTGSGTTGAVSTDASYSGTKSWKAVRPSAGYAYLNYDMGADVPGGATGLYQRWYQRCDSAMLTALASNGQTKILLNRSAGGNTWLDCGLGPEFQQNVANEFVALMDSGNTAISGSKTGFVITADAWVEIQTYFKRTAGSGAVDLWINGKKYMSTSNASLGSDTPANTIIGLGIIYSQNAASGTQTMYLDEVAAANGFLDPVVV